MLQLVVRPLRSLALVFGLCALSTAASATTIGNPSSTSGTVVDGCPACGYVLGTPAGTSGYVTSYSFFADTSGTGDITPLILSGVSNGDGTMTFTVTGVGADVTLTDVDQEETFAFDLTSGSAAVGPNSYFGFYNTNGSLVTFNYDNNGAGTYLTNGGLGVGNTYTGQDVSLNYNGSGLNDRTYQINADIATTPEPSTFSLMGLGLLGIGGVVKRRYQS